MTDVAVVTGAGRGIGAGLARALSDRGLHVVVTDVDGAAATRTADALPGPATALPLDVRDPGAHRSVAAAAADLGEVTVWVNNAGVLSTAPVWEATDAEVTATVEINTLGVVHGCRAAVDVMRRGDILNVVSLSGLGPTPGLAIYGASKAAALSYVQALHTELGGARRPIRCLALCPDAVSTELLRAVSDRPSSALLFTGPRVLGVDEVVAAGIAMLDGRRELRVLPGWRGWLTRTQSMLPTAARTLTPMVARIGERRRPGG
ncbi:SDR family oxidoreductase [Actinomycetospora chiangmaiensis]|uniref:SDR family oxidoreductase n=1 Tax=Actinomycetospora chiangmaiensis TaxID=402650 RepID=UPI00037A30B2|nr:SDR family NAD(P)-dependent oxidoreductase [Actinomycetospora chiangmaiensis]